MKMGDSKQLFKKAVDARLRIKQLQTRLVGIEAAQQAKPKIMAFFVNPALFEQPKQVGAGGRKESLARKNSVSMGRQMVTP